MANDDNWFCNFEERIRAMGHEPDPEILELLGIMSGTREVVHQPLPEEPRTRSDIIADKIIEKIENLKNNYNNRPMRRVLFPRRTPNRKI